MSKSDQAAATQNEIEIDPSSYVDPNGFLFRHQGHLLRAISRDAAPFYRSLFDDGTIERLIANHGLVPTSVFPGRVPGIDSDLILEHEPVKPLSYCPEWCPSMLRDAGASLLDLALAIVDREMILQDCYPWNVLFSGTRPVIVDFTSIISQGSPLLWPAFEQFEAFFMRPLLLASAGKGDVARALLNDNINGISLEQFFRNSGCTYRVLHPGLLISHALYRCFESNAGLKRKLKHFLSGVQGRADVRIRRRFLEKQRRRLERLTFVHGEFDAWQNYYAQIDAAYDKEMKVASVRRLLEQFRPDSALDLGCNTGVFSMLAAEAGARVTAIDGSEACIERLYREAGRRTLSITPLIANLFCPTPPGGYMAEQYPGLLQRVRSDTVLCLGLMHHLHVTGRQTLARIAELMNAVCKHHLIFEYVGPDDDNIALLGAGRPIDYSLPDVIGALARFFEKIETLPSDRPTRRLLACSKTAS